MDQVLRARIEVGMILAATAGIFYLAYRAMKPREPFDPWVYDLDGDGVISQEELGAAEADWQAGLITRAQYLEVLALYVETN